MNYRKLYLEQRAISLNLEIQLMNVRAQMIARERTEIEKGLRKYVTESEAPKTD